MSITPFPSQGQYPWYDQLEQWGADTQAAAENASSFFVKTDNLFNVLKTGAPLYTNGITVENGSNPATLQLDGKTTSPIVGSVSVPLMTGSGATGNFMKFDTSKPYTVTVTVLNGKAADSRAVTLLVQRTDTSANMASLAIGALLLSGGTLSSTFTPTFTTGKVTLVLSAGAYEFGPIQLLINISEGTTPSATYYGYSIGDVIEFEEIKTKIAESQVYTCVVDKSGRGDYTTLTEAVAAAPNGSSIFVRNGLYDNEQVKAWLKTLYITGESRHGVVITNSTGEYATPPIEMGSGLLKNLTVYAKDPGGGLSPSNKTYAIHSEADAVFNGKFSIENCTIKSDWRQAWGMGMRGGCVIEAKNTDFIGGVYVHDSDYDHRLGIQWLSFKDCNITREGTTAALFLQSQEKAGSMTTLEMIRCLIKGDTTNYQTKNWHDGTGGPDDFLGLVNWRLSKYSWGNSEPTFNAFT